MTFFARLCPQYKLNTDVSEVISQKLVSGCFEVAVLGVDQDKGGSGDPGDSAGAGGDVLEGAPSLGEQSESALA